MGGMLVVLWASGQAGNMELFQGEMPLGGLGSLWISSQLPQGGYCWRTWWDLALVVRAPGGGAWGDLLLRDHGAGLVGENVREPLGKWGPRDRSRGHAAGLGWAWRRGAALWQDPDLCLGSLRAALCTTMTRPRVNLEARGRAGPCRQGLSHTLPGVGQAGAGPGPFHSRRFSVEPFVRCH